MTQRFCTAGTPGAVPTGGWAGGTALAPGEAPFVSIVIVNYNGRRFLRDCLSALDAQTWPSDRRETILVDNGSTDDSVDQVRQQFPAVRVLTAGKNLGFAGGNNAGIGQARGDFIALLNNDTVVQPTWLERLVEALQEDPRIGGATGKILLKNEPDRINSAGLNLYHDGRAGDRGFREVDGGQFEEPADVFGACGASVLLRREMLEDVGLLDERFFMYCEDLDLAWRARLRGWRFRYTPKSVVFHVHCGTSGEWSPFFAFYAERNTVLANLKNAPARQALRAFAGFAGRGAKQWLRVLTLQERGARSRGRALAYGRALVSLLAVLPETLCKRFLVRRWRRRVPDSAFADLILPPP